MQRLILKRKYREGEATLGIITLDGKEICRTLENPWVDNQVNISCIPEGKYLCQTDDTGKFQWWKVLGVEGRSGVEIHQGNRERDTQGCIIIGKKWGFIANELAVFTSRVTLEKLKQILDDEFELEIIKMC